MTTSPPSPSARDLPAVLFRVAWLSIALGLAMEVLFVGIDLVAASGDVKKYLADFVQKVSWSLFVCVGLALGTAASNARAAWLGLAGLLSAPIAFTIARALHKSAAQALSGTAPASPAAPPVAVLAALKAVEYAFLGVALAELWRRRRHTLRNHVLVGLAAGLLFGGAVLALRASAGAPAAAMVALAVNELVFPVGCSVVLFAARALGRRAEAVGADD